VVDTAGSPVGDIGVERFDSRLVADPSARQRWLPAGRLVPRAFESIVEMADIIPASHPSKST
jgi:hypothetical protein